MPARKLVAEMASAFLCACQSTTPTVRRADYIGAWLIVLRNDARAIFQTASMASKTADSILGCMADKERSDTAD
jgi:antirestriction protein ArdC